MQELYSIHPKVIHFPIVFFLVYSILTVIGIFVKNRSFDFYTTVVLFIGVIFGIIAVLTGNLSYQDQLEIGVLSEAHKIAVDDHEYFASLSLWYFLFVLVVQFYFYVKNKKETYWRLLFIIFGVIGFYIIYKTGEYGGLLVYKYGIGTELIK